MSDPSVPILDFADPAGSFIEAELALRAENRTLAGLANLGPGALELAAAMDAAAARVLADVGADSAVDSGASGFALRSTAAGAGQLIPSPGSNAWTVWGTLYTSLDHFANNPRSGTVEAPPETVTIGGNVGTVTTTMTLNAVVSGSTLSVDVTIKLKARLVDGTTGAELYSIDSSASGHVDLNFCPDAGGKAAVHVKLSSSETYSQGGGGARGIDREMSADASVSVGDDANITTVEGVATGAENSYGGVPPAELSVSTRTSSDNIANDGNGRRLPDVARNISLGGEGSTTDEQVRFFGSTNIFMELMVTAAAKEAEKLWKSGKCVELLVDPEGGDVQPDEVTTVTAKLKHKIEGNELDKPIEATLTGVKTIDPAGERQPAPATVTHTAGSNEGDVGRIAFKAVSNRGIAEKTVTFTVRPSAWNVTFTGTDTETFGPVSSTFTAAITELKITSNDGVLSGNGMLRLTGTVSSGMAGVSECKGPLDQVATTVVTGSLVGTGPDAVLRVVVRSTSPPGAVVTLTCTNVLGAIGDAELPADGHAERFGESLAEFDLPAAGGTIAVSTTAAIGGLMQVTVEGSFVVTKAP